MSEPSGKLRGLEMIQLRPHHAPRFRTLQLFDAPGAVTLPLAGYRQARDYTCGFASALMVLHYFGAHVPALELYQRLGTRRDGTRQSALVRELRASGLRANVRYDVDFARLRRELDRNKLVIGYLHDIEHWLVVYGYGGGADDGDESEDASQGARESDGDDEDGAARVFVADPRPGEACEHAWDGYGERLRGFGIVCSAPRGVAAARQRALALSATPLSALAARRAVRRPESPLPHLRCDVNTDSPSAPEPTESAPATSQLALPLG